jgi:CRISPR-associated protein Csb2
MFALEVEYLLGRSFAGRFQDRSQSEWPPHPGRLFSALAAAYFENGEPVHEREALQWLEQQPPPSIHAGSTGMGAAPLAYVPTNYAGANVPILREKQPRFFPAQGPSEATVHFIWDAAPPDRTANALGNLAERTGYLGKACSVVQIRRVKAPPEANWKPDMSGEDVLRVPSAGRLNELKRLFAADQMVSAGAQQRYRCTDKLVESKDIAESVFGPMLVYRRIAGPGLPIEAALTLTDAVRRALMSIDGAGGPIEPILSGHEGVHCAVAPLPFVEHEHADGRLIGFAVILPRAVELHDRRVVMKACKGLEDNGLNINKDSRWEWKLEAADAATPFHALRTSTWTRPAREWRTVTPILLDRFPKKKGPTVEDILQVACERAGLPAPESIEHSPYSQVDGVPPVPKFRLQRPGEKRTRWGVHATFRFAGRVRGPLLLGAGRFFGMGLMRPCREATDEQS